MADDTEPPEIKLRDGWHWEWYRIPPRRLWHAHENGASTCGVVTIDAYGNIATDGDCPSDVVLAVILANNSAAFHHAASALALDVPDGEFPKHYSAVELTNNDGKLLSWIWLANGTPHAEDIENRDERPLTLKKCRAQAMAHRADVAADCYPQMATEIASLREKLDHARHGWVHQLYASQCVSDGKTPDLAAEYRQYATLLFDEEEARRLYPETKEAP